MTATTYENARYGYALMLAPGWRFSSRLTRDDACANIMPTSTCDNLGSAVFTTRSVGEEARLLAGPIDDVGPASFYVYVVEVSVTRNPDRLTPIQWVRLPGRGYEPEKAVPTAVQGHEAARMNYRTFVGRDDLMFEIRYIPGPAVYPEWIPQGWTAAQVEQAAERIVASFRSTR